MSRSEFFINILTATAGAFLIALALFYAYEFVVYLWNLEDFLLSVAAHSH